MILTKERLEELRASYDPDVDSPNDFAVLDTALYLIRERETTLEMVKNLCETLRERR